MNRIHPEEELGWNTRRIDSSWSKGNLSGRVVSNEAVEIGRIQTMQSFIGHTKLLVQSIMESINGFLVK